MDSAQGTCGFAQVGFPIRKSPDQRSFSSSPRLIAAIHVLHRLLVPRHPPCALVLLISPNIRSENTTYRYAVLKVRASTSPQCESLPVRPTAMKVGPPATRGVSTPGPGLSKLNSKAPSRAPHSREHGGKAVQTRCQRYFQASPIDAKSTHVGVERSRTVCPACIEGRPAEDEIHRIPRKEVIQPQLPLRLPCYDFTPVTNSTFDCSLPYGLGHRLRVSPASVV